MDFTAVFALYFSADGSGLLIHSLVNGFQDGLRAVFLSGWQPIANTTAHQGLSRQIARRFAPAADCSYFHSSMAFTTVYAPHLIADDSGLLILSLIKGFHDGFRTLLLSGWQLIAHTYVRQWFSRWFLH